VARRALVSVAVLAVFAGFVALGAWQLERRAWKHALMGRIAERIHAEPVPAPRREEWPQVTVPTHEYRRVVAQGYFEHNRQTRVQAVTALGPGFWLLTPLRLDDGGTLLVNRGFVGVDLRDGTSHVAADASPPGSVEVVGLLRMSEPGGGFLRRNDPAADRWFSRDVEAITAARGVRDAAPYFIDAERDPGAPPGAPVGGLTVVSFNDNHLGYALTWFALAAMTGAAAVLMVREAQQRRHGSAPL
jgi:surfeit locus 1 family protein